MEKTQKNLVTIIAAVFAGLGASLCCILPIAVAVLGVGSAAFAVRMEPLRPYLLVLTIVLLGLVFYREYRAEPCEAATACSAPTRRTRQRILLWIIAVVILAVVTFPYYAGRLF